MSVIKSTIQLVCPKCQEPLDIESQAYACTKCSSKYPIVFGIPDLRTSDPFFFTKEKEKENVAKLIDNFAGNSYADLVRLRFSNEIRQDLLERYLRSWLGAVERNSSLLERVEKISKSNGYSSKNRTALDIGCGTGGMSIALASKYEHVVGVDVSMESLIYAKKLLEENNCDNVHLYCCGVDSLPFKENTFDTVSASNVIEHIQDQQKAMKEIHRVQKIGSIFFGDIPNRYSLEPEPHVNLRFVGFLPRKLATHYVWLLKKRHYEGYNLPGYFELSELCKQVYGVNNVRIHSFGRIVEKIRRLFISRQYIPNGFLKLTSFFCHYFIVIARKT